LGRKLTLISAPAGFGKTTLISEWVAECKTQREPEVAWLSLDEGDNDPARFLAYLVAALQMISKDVGKGVLEAIQPSQPLTTIHEFLLATLLNEIAAIPVHFVLVLDDYHVIDSEPIDAAITFLLDHLPPQMHLVITTREDPHLPLARYRARGQLTELRAADLRFTPAGSRRFLNQMMNLNLSPENIAALEARTEGWIAGLQLAALSMQGSGKTSPVLSRPLPAAIVLCWTIWLKKFFCTCLNRSAASYCKPLFSTGFARLYVMQSQSGKMAKKCWMFWNTATCSSFRWMISASGIRYHRLFADVLQTHLMEAQPDRIAALHIRASAWYERNGLRSDAIRHALAAKDFELAAGLIELAWPAAENGTISQVAWLGWVSALPEALIQARPVLAACMPMHY
jgi:LuxR family transcriptional regulator, maltose regulon positive regulatory protein